MFLPYHAELSTRGAPVLAMVALEGPAETVRRRIEGARTGTLPAAPSPTMVTITVQIRAQDGGAGAVAPRAPR